MRKRKKKLKICSRERNSSSHRSHTRKEISETTDQGSERQPTSEMEETLVWTRSPPTQQTLVREGESLQENCLPSSFIDAGLVAIGSATKQLRTNSPHMGRPKVCSFMDKPLLNFIWTLDPCRFTPSVQLLLLFYNSRNGLNCPRHHLHYAQRCCKNSVRGRVRGRANDLDRNKKCRHLWVQREFF